MCVNFNQCTVRAVISQNDKTHKYRNIFCILLLKEHFFKYLILKVREKVWANLKTLEIEVQ